MIDLTPLEVRKKKEDFRRALRGYEPVDVDTFLELVADRMEQLVRENLALSEKAGRLEDEIAGYRERERALTDALVSAQEMREELRKQAARDADELRRAAEAEAERLRGGMLQALQREENALREVKARRAQLMQKYRAMLERELSELGVLMQTLEIGEEEGLGQLGVDDFADQLLPIEESTGAEAALTPALPPDGPVAPAAFANSAPSAGPAPSDTLLTPVSEDEAESILADLDLEPAAELEPTAESVQQGPEAKTDEAKPGASPLAKAQDEDYSEGLDWLSSLLREDP